MSMDSHLNNNVGQLLSEKIDPESEASLSRMTELENLTLNRVSGVKFVLFVLSSGGLAYDREGLRQRVLFSYPDSVVFFHTTLGKPIGPSAPEQLDLVIDLTGPGQRQPLFYPRKLRRMARVVVGRNAGFFRKRIYDRVYDEKLNLAQLPAELLLREKFVQKKVLHLAGISLVETGDTPPDRGKSLPLELPSMQNL